MSKIIIKNQEQIEGIRKSCILAAQTLKYVVQFVTEGVSTVSIDDKIDEFIRDHGAIPAPLNYRSFPKSSCISINEVVCHGIPSDKVFLKSGDIVNIDVTTILNGYFGDTSAMFTIGEISDSAKHLINVSKKCLDIGINQCFPMNHIGNIGYMIGNYANSQKCSVVYEFCGHGVGLEFHEEPEIQHKDNKNTGPLMLAGMIFTIEPMINQGKARTVIDKKDGWTARTIDKKLSAQYEHTILITPGGREVLTDIDNEYPIT